MVGDGPHNPAHSVNHTTSATLCRATNRPGWPVDFVGRNGGFRQDFHYALGRADFWPRISPIRTPAINPTVAISTTDGPATSSRTTTPRTSPPFCYRYGAAAVPLRPVLARNLPFVTPGTLNDAGPTPGVPGARHEREHDGTTGRVLRADGTRPCIFFCVGQTDLKEHIWVSGYWSLLQGWVFCCLVMYMRMRAFCSHSRGMCQFKAM